MAVLVAVASRHGATEQIAEMIGKQIHAGGFGVDVVRLTDASPYGPRGGPAPVNSTYSGGPVGSFMTWRQNLRQCRQVT